MRLKKLEIQGFKSFADRTEISFEQGITGIVGPNGCGKSNISDAVRWVLGEQSAKTLRGAKMEDVIFGGTEKRRRLSFCEVALTFDNSDRALPLDYAEVSVSRRVYRSGESEYQINRGPCRLRDVVELFRDTGIGKEGYSLIGQGRIDEILSVKSEDRRQIFEEAAGIVKYKARKNEAEHRIENTRQNLTRVEDILGELEDRVEPLRAQSETAREYLSLRDELKGLELNVFLMRTERYQERLRELEATLSGLTEALSEATARQAALTEQRDGVQASLGDLEERAAAQRESVQRLIREVEARDGSVKLLTERIAARERERERVEGELNAARQGGGGVQSQLGFLRGKIDADEKELALASENQKKDEEALRASEEALSLREAEAEAAKARLIELMNRESDVRSEEARLGAMREQLKSRLSSLETDEASGRDEGGRYQSAVSQCEENLAREALEKRRLDELSAQAVLRVRELGEKGEELSETISSLTARGQELSSRLKVLEEMQRDLEGYQFAVKNVLLQAQRTGGSGVRGAVASLIRVPRELEKAIDMVLGAALQNLVVDSEEDAKRMIDYLRKNRLGRATFLPLSAVRGRTLDASERRCLSMPGCLGLASELIEYDGAYKGVVDSLLGRTVVAKDLDAGIQIMRAGRHAFRLVTLEGDVMHSGGSMTGGSAQSRMTSLLSREREIAEHREALSEARGALEKARAESERLNLDRARLKQERGELFEKLHQQEIAVAREEAHLKAAQDDMDAHEGRSQRLCEARAQIEEQLQDVAARGEAIAGRQAGEGEDKKRLQEEILLLQKGLVSLRQGLDAARNAVSDGRVSIAARARDLGARRADFERLDREKNDLARLLRENGDALEKIGAALAEDNAALSAERGALAESRTALDAARERFGKLDKSRVEAQDSLREISQALDALRAEIDGCADRKARGEVLSARLESEFKQMNDRVWEDYELSYEGAMAYRDESFRLTESEKRIAAIRARIKAMGSVNVSAVDEYRETMKRVEEISAQRDDLLRAEGDLNKIIDDLVRVMEKQFVEEFEKLNRNFQETFVRLFGGGQAELRLADGRDALNCGIDIVAQPPGKKLQMLSLLSGGERALTAIAILFAMLKLKPTPFCFLDEIEAALDDANIAGFADYLHDYARDTQFVVVTHRKGTMERCDALYGVAMEEKGVSRMVSVKLSEVA